MVQVVTNENIQQLIQTRTVPEFKAPETSAAGTGSDGSAAGGAVTSGAGTGSNDAQPPLEKSSADGSTPARGPDGKFVKTEEKQPEKTADDTAVKTAEHDDDDPALTEKIRKLINKKHRAMKEAEEFGRDEARRALAAEARADALEREIQALKGTKSGEGPAPSKGDDEPKAEDFKTVGEYTRALVKWEQAQARKAEAAQKTQDTQKQAIETVQAQFSERVAQVASEIPDYREVIAEADWEVPHHMQAFLVDSEIGPQLGYHLAKNRGEFDRIAKLSPIRAFAELGKLEDQLKSKAAPPAKEPAPAAPAQVSRAPAPITPLEGKTTPVVKDPSTMSFAELRAYRQAERAAGKVRV